MSNQKKANESLYNIPLFRKVKEHSNNEKNMNNINKNEDSHCLEDFQKELNNLHLDAQNQYETICKNKSLHKTQENLVEDFMDPDWFAREAENRKKHNLQKQPEEDASMMVSPPPTQTKESFPMDNFSKQQTIEKFFPMGTMTVSTNKKIVKQSHNILNDLPKLDKQNINTNKNISRLSFEFNDNNKHQELVFDNQKKSTRKRKASPTLYEEYEWNQKQKNKNKQLKSNFINTQTSKKCIPQNKEEYRSFLKWNFTIFITAFINVLLILLICFSYLQIQTFHNLQIPSDIYRTFFIMSLLFAYQIASLHCGYTITKHRLIKMKKTIKVLLYPILLVILLIIGFICEIPYCIFSCFQLENNIPEN